MKGIWPYIYCAGAVACAVIGYYGLVSKSAAHQKNDWYFVAETFLLFLLYPIAIVVLRRVLRGEDQLCKPSQFVKPTNGTLQFIRVLLVACMFICLGQFAALPRVTHRTFMEFWPSVAAVLGLFLAEQFIYRFYSRNIIP